MKPYRIQWLNKGLAEHAWFMFIPDIKAIAIDEAHALRAVENTLRLDQNWKAGRLNTRAVEITWEEYEYKA